MLGLKLGGIICITLTALCNNRRKKLQLYYYRLEVEQDGAMVFGDKCGNADS